MGALRRRSNQCQKKGNGLSSAVALTLHPLNTYVRVTAWLEETPRANTRRSAFAVLAA
jgi:hypothetical protein